jgi:hypothetical protein
LSSCCPGHIHEQNKGFVDFKNKRLAMRNMKRYAPIFATMAIYFCSYVKSNIDIFGLMLSNNSFDFFYTPVRPPNAKPVRIQCSITADHQMHTLHLDTTKSARLLFVFPSFSHKNQPYVICF